MSYQEIINAVQIFFNNPDVFNYNLPIATNDSLGTSTAIRMINSYKKYLLSESNENKIEFECSLRNYLLFMKTEVVIKGYVLTEPNRFGLKMNFSKASIYANMDLPQYINSEFVRMVFDSRPLQKELDDKAIIEVNPYIYRLTNHRFKTFKSIEQQLAVMGALRVPSGYTAMISMATGGGKSLITQMVSYQFDEGLTVIIVPTISLMLDQQRNALKIISPKNKNEIMYYHSGRNAEELVSAIDKKIVRMLFISPETVIKNTKIQNSIFSANSKGYLKNLIIDEAHIIVEWGSAFREDFQCLDSLRKALIKDNINLRTFLISATFSQKTIDNLKLFYSDDNRWIEIRLDSLRKEPLFDVIKCGSYTEKHDRLKEIVCKLPRPMIVYVNSPDDAEIVHSELAEIGFNNTRVFTGHTSSSERETIIDEWVNDKFDLMIATCAFGVGVDKKDVRTVIHSYVPSGPDQYYQECGRGGRDGLACLSVILYTENDIKTAMSMTQKVLTVEKLSGRWFSMLNSENANIQLDYIVLDTSVKPNYNEDDKFYGEVNNADVKWNVDVILLLRRAGLINILDVKYVDGRYIFKIQLIDRQIRFDTEYTFEIFNKIRDKESASIYSEINTLVNKLRKVKNECWSSMFNDIYSLTDEYCAGCNNHNNIKAEKKKSFPLKKYLCYPTLTPTGKLCEVMNDTNEMLIICENNHDEVIQILFNSGADIIVLPDESKIPTELLESENIYSKQFCMGYNEFFELCRMNCYYYLSGNIVFYVGDDNKLADRLLNITFNNEYNRILIVNSDLYIQSRNKNISEVINGACKYDYIIKKELI